jgi:hypothetical protein
MRNRMVLAAALATVLGASLVGAPAQAVSLLSAPAPAVQADDNFRPTTPPVVRPGEGKALKGTQGKRHVPGRQVVPPTIPSATGFYYAGQHEAHNSIGTSAAVKVMQPYANTAGGNGHHSLVEVDVELMIDATNDGINNPQRNIVEAGWNVDPGVNGDSKPHIFVYRWKNGVPSGAYNGGGFVEYTTYCSTAGAICAGDDASSWIGLTTSNHWIIQYFNNAWWVGLENNWIGWFPDSVWTTGSPVVTGFNHTDYVQGFGEVYAGTAKPCDDMGNGKFATNTAPTSAAVTSQAYISEPVTNVNMVGFSSEPTIYNHLSTSTRSVYFGGAGTNSTGGLPGNIGSC